MRFTQCITYISEWKTSFSVSKLLTLYDRLIGHLPHCSTVWICRHCRLYVLQLCKCICTHLSQRKCTWGQFCRWLCSIVFFTDPGVVMVMYFPQIDPARMTGCRSCDSARRTCALGVWFWFLGRWCRPSWWCGGRTGRSRWHPRDALCFSPNLIGVSGNV